MTIDLQSIATIGLACFTGLLGWLGRELWSAVQSLRTDLGKLEVKLSEEYVRYDRMEKVMEPVLKKLDRIEDALVHKVDKP